MDNTLTHWKKLINPDYIGAYALTPDEDLVVTIDYVQRQEVVGTGGKKEECTVAHLVDQKPMILNVTNSKSIAKLYGVYIEDWSGKQITLYASSTKLAGEMVECLRIRPSAPVKRKPTIAAARLAKAIASIKAGEFTVEKLRAGWDLTEEQHKEVNAAMEKNNVQD